MTLKEAIVGTGIPFFILLINAIDFGSYSPRFTKRGLFKKRTMFMYNKRCVYNVSFSKTLALASFPQGNCIFFHEHVFLHLL